MAFGQQSGPPASGRQVQDLTALIIAAGHADFRDARGPLGLTQRQAGGKFTRDEADDLIARLEAEAEAEAELAQDGASIGAAPAPPPPTDRRQAERIKMLEKMSSEMLAAELQRRGWVVMEP